jgi:ribosome modulation factor
MTHWDTLLRHRKAMPTGYAYAIEGGASPYGMDVVRNGDARIDEKLMGVFVPYADGNARDGVGDLIEVAGIDLSRHQQNPVVLFDHGKHVSLPVGLARHPDTKAYTVEIDPNSRTAGAMAYFYQGRPKEMGEGPVPADHGRFCEQLFDLIVKGFVRGGSIGYTVTHARELPADWERGIPKGLHLLAVRQLELSAVVMPCNQDTVRKSLGNYQKNLADAARRILSMPKVCGVPLSPYLVKSLTPMVKDAPTKVQVGWEAKARDDSRDEVILKCAEGYVESWNETQWIFQFTPKSIDAKRMTRQEARRAMAADQTRGKHNFQMETLTYKSMPAPAAPAAPAPNKPKENPKPEAGYHKGVLAIRKKYRRKANPPKQGPYEQGYAARLANKDAQACPYVANDPLRQEWVKGFKQAEDDLKKQTGQKRIFNANEAQWVKPNYGVWNDGGAWYVVTRTGSRMSGGLPSYQAAVDYLQQASTVKPDPMMRDYGGLSGKDLVKAIRLKYRVKTVPVWFSTDGMVWVREDYPDTAAANVAVRQALQDGEEAVTRDPSKSMKGVKVKTRMASTDNTSEYMSGDRAAAREHLRTFTPGQRGSEEFAKPGEPLTIVAVEPSGRLLVRNRAGKMEYFSSAQVRKTKALPVRTKDASPDALKAADFVTLPESVKGTNCSNCRFQENKVCQNPEIQGQPVTERNCCALWDAEGTQRPWETGQGEKSLKAIRLKYRAAKSVRRRLKSSKSGSSVVYVKQADFDKVKGDAKAKGITVKLLGESGADYKLKMTGDDGGIDAIANQYGQPIGGV